MEKSSDVGRATISFAHNLLNTSISLRIQRGVRNIDPALARRMLKLGRQIRNLAVCGPTVCRDIGIKVRPARRQHRARPTDRCAKGRWKVGARGCSWATSRKIPSGMSGEAAFGQLSGLLCFSAPVGFSMATASQTSAGREGRPWTRSAGGSPERVRSGLGFRRSCFRALEESRSRRDRLGTSAGLLPNAGGAKARRTRDRTASTGGPGDCRRLEPEACASVAAVVGARATQASNALGEAHFGDPDV